MSWHVAKGIGNKDAIEELYPMLSEGFHHFRTHTERDCALSRSEHMYIIWLQYILFDIRSQKHSISTSVGEGSQVVAIVEHGTHKLQQ